MGFLSRSQSPLENGLPSATPPPRPSILGSLRRRRTSDTPARPDSADGAEPFETKNGSGSPASDEEQHCARLRDELRRVGVEFRSARQHADEVRKALAAKRDEAEQKFQKFLTLAADVAVSAVSTVIELRKGRLPRDIKLPSDAQRAWRAYREADAEGESLEAERDRVERMVERLEGRLGSIRHEMATAGCVG